MRRFMEDMDRLRQITPSLLNMDKVVKNSTLGKVAYIWRLQRFQIDAIKFEKTQIHFLVMFSPQMYSTGHKIYTHWGVEVWNSLTESGYCRTFPQVTNPMTFFA